MDVHEEEQSLIGRAELIESQPLEQRAAGYDQLADLLLGELQRGDHQQGGQPQAGQQQSGQQHGDQQPRNENGARGDLVE